jgi:predicted RND superfamily exporter protein
MYGYKRTIEQTFQYLGVSVIRYRLAILLATVVLAGLAATQLHKLSLATSVETLFRGHDQNLADYQRFRDQFGRDEDILLLVSTTDIFDFEFIATLKQFHEDLENSVPLLKAVESLVNAPYSESVDGSVRFRGFLDNLPRTEREVEQYRQNVYACPGYRNLYFTPDGKHAVVVIKTQAISALSPDGRRLRAYARGAGEVSASHPSNEPRQSISQVENIAVIGIVEAVIKQYQSPDFSIAFSGTPVYQYHVEPMIRTNMKKMCITILLVPLLLMPIVFGRGSGAFLPQITAVLGLMIALGLMAFLSVRFSQTSSMLPSILLSIGLTAPIHFLVVYYKHQKRVGKFRGLVATMKHSGFPIAMTSFTTMAGLLSFSFSEVAPIADLVNFTIVGIFAILVFTLAPLPAFLSILQVVEGSEKGEVNYEASIFNRTLLALGCLGVSRPKLVVMVFLVVTLAAGSSIHRLQFSHNQLHYFSKDSDFMRQVRSIEGCTGGFRALEIMIDTHRDGGITDAHILKAMAQLDLQLRSKTDSVGHAYVGRTRSIINPLREVAGSALDQNQIPGKHSGNEQPQVERIDPIGHIAPRSLRQYADADLRTGRMTAMMYWRDAARDVDFIEQVRQSAGTLFGKGVDVVVTGVVAIQSGIIHAMMSSLSIGYTTGFLMIAVLMILTVADLRLGMLAMIPNLLPIVMALGVMGHLGIPLNTYNLIGGSIAIGLAVDDTIHFFHNFQKSYQKSGDIHFAVKETLATAGRALLATTLILVFSFWMRLFSSLKVVADFGLVMGIALLVAFLADVLLAPALLRIYYRGRQISPPGVLVRAKGATP